MDYLEGGSSLKLKRALALEGGLPAAHGQASAPYDSQNPFAKKVTL